MPLSIDHIVIAVADLDAAVRDYTALGFTVLPGGEHPRGSRNALVVFADGAYLAATRPNVAAAAVGAAPTVSVVVENPWTGEQVQAVVRSVVVDGIAQQARTQRRDFRAGVA